MERRGVTTSAESFEAGGPLKTLAKQRFVINLVKRFSSSCLPSPPPSSHSLCLAALFLLFLPLPSRASAIIINGKQRDSRDATNNFLLIAVRKSAQQCSFHQEICTQSSRALQLRLENGYCIFNRECFDVINNLRSAAAKEIG